MAILVSTTTLVPQARPGGLLAAARSLEDGWERGLDVFVGALNSPDRVAPCAVGSGETDPGGEVARFEPVLVRQGIHCSALGRPDVASKARQVVSTTLSWAVSQELFDGAATGNPSLSDATSLGTVTDLLDAIARLEDAAEQALTGRLAFIHVPVGLSAYLKFKVGDDGMIRTNAGNVIVIHGSGNTVYATGEVFAAASTVEAREYTDRAVNRTDGWADALALAVFDPAFNVSVTITGDTSPTSPTEE